MKIAITGASGFVGQRLSDRLVALNHVVRGVSTRAEINPRDFEGCDAVIHLAGEPVAQRWTDASRARIRSSRVQGTQALVEALRANPPRVLVSASAIGYYGSRGDDVLTESSPPAGDFLAKVCVEWEQAALAAEKFGIRVVMPRIGVVLSAEGGALAQMIPLFRLGVGGRIGDGRQWMSWIHIDDLVSLIEFALVNTPLRGPVNAAAPEPVTNREFTRELARVLHRPAILPVPRFALKLLLGDMSAVVLASQRVRPELALNAGFQFRFPNLHSALADLFG